MKKITVLLLMFLYLFPTIGISVSVHYCGGKISSFSVLFNTTKCGCNKKKMKKGCCTETTKNFQIKDSQNASKQLCFTSFKTNKNKPIYFSFNSYLHPFFAPIKLICFAHHPNKIKPQQLFKMNSVFLI